MPAYLITGRSGSGKTAICGELRRRGYNAFDADRVTGLAGWISPRTALPTKVDYSKPINKEFAQWWWNETILRHTISQYRIIFLCGSADNQLQFHGLFGKVFTLDLPARLQRERIITRSEHDYGKLPEMQEQIIKEQRLFTKRAKELGAVVIDASPRVMQVTDSILELL